MMDFGLGMGALGLIMMLLFWAGLIAVAVWLVRMLFPVARKQSDDDSPLLSTQDIVKARYAQEELSDRQYQ